MSLHVDSDASTAAQPRPAWFRGLRRGRPRLLGGVAAGLADFWGVDPLLVRVTLLSPFVTGLLALMALPWFDDYLGGLAVLGTQMIWLLAGAAATAYLLAWVLIPWEDRDSPARRLLGLDGAFGGLVKLVVTVTSLLLLGWAWLAFGLSLADLGLDPLALALGAFLATVGLGLAALWIGRERDLRTVLGRLGTPGLGRFDAGEHEGAAAPPQPGVDPARAYPPQPDPGTNSHPPAAGPTNPAAAPPMPEWIGADPAVDAPTPAPGSVDRARAAAQAAAEAEAAAAEAARRLRVEQRRARRAAARAERKRRNRWGWLVAAVTLIGAGLLAITDELGVTDLGLLGVGLVSLALLTAGILVGSFYGSARWLILPALLLSGALAAGSAVTTMLDQSAAAPPVHVVPTKISNDQATRWDFAAVTVDLTEATDLPGNGMSLSVDRGSLTVIVPSGQRTSVSSEVLIGTNNAADEGLHVGDVTLGASGYDEWGTPSDEPDAAARLYLNLRVGVGELTVIRQES